MSSVVTGSAVGKHLMRKGVHLLTFSETAPRDEATEARPEQALLVRRYPPVPSGFLPNSVECLCVHAGYLVPLDRAGTRNAEQRASTAPIRD